MILSVVSAHRPGLGGSLDCPIPEVSREPQRLDLKLREATAVICKKSCMDGQLSEMLVHYLGSQVDWSVSQPFSGDHLRVRAMSLHTSHVLGGCFGREKVAQDSARPRIQSVGTGQAKVTDPLGRRALRSILEESDGEGAERAFTLPSV